MLLTSIYASKFFFRNLMFKSVLFLQSFLRLQFTHSRQNTYLTLSHRSRHFFYNTFTTSYGIITKIFDSCGIDFKSNKFKLNRNISNLIFKFMKRLRFRGLSIITNAWFGGLNYIIRGLLTTPKMFLLIFKPRWIFGLIYRKKFRRLKKKLVKKIY
jgi:hypothetical protein